MRLFLDRGNSSVKWAAHDGANWHSEGRLHLQADGHVSNDALEELPAAEEWWLASVARDERDATLVAQLEQVRGVKLQRISTSAEAAGVRCAYADPSRLGVDRWLAVIAVHVEAGAAIAIDAGTAVTIDAVDSDGRHLGGVIAPGLALMRRALYQNTDRIPEEQDEPAELLGTDTRGAVASGTRHAVAGLVDRVVARLQADGKEFSIFITGGDAAELQGLLETPTIHRPRLVLDGMRHVADSRRQHA